MDDFELEFTRIAKEYRKTVYTICYFFSEDPRDVDDMFQEVMLNIWKSYPKFRGESSIKTWIWRIGLNTCSNSNRIRRRSVSTVPLTVEVGGSDQSEEGSRQMQMLYDRISRLDLFDRAIILLWLENLKYDEIAQIVGISTSAVTGRLFRIKERLKSGK